MKTDDRPSAIFFQRALLPPTVGKCCYLEGVLEHPEYGTVPTLYTKIVTDVYRGGTVFRAGGLVYIRLRNDQRSCANEDCRE